MLVELFLFFVERTKERSDVSAGFSICHPVHGMYETQIAWKQVKRCPILASLQSGSWTILSTMTTVVLNPRTRREAPLSALQDFKTVFTSPTSARLPQATPKLVQVDSPLTLLF